MRKLIIVTFLIVALPFAFAPLLLAQETNQDSALDKKVRAFLDSDRRQWHDMNVPEVDGKLLHDIIIKNKYTRALEIGTSTGRSGIWIAWALSKTGGKLISLDTKRRWKISRKQGFRNISMRDSPMHTSLSRN
jgi:predicted O-methyltransferase YrrM